MKAGRAYAGDMSQADLAEALGMSHGYIKTVEAGKRLKDLEARALLERLPEVTGLPRSFFTGEDPAGEDSEKIDRILAELRELRGEAADRYAVLDEIIRQRRETERRIRHMSAEEADEMIRLLQEARARTGRDVGRRSLPARAGGDRRAAP